MEIKRLRSRGCNVYLLEMDGIFLIDTGTPASAKLLESQLRNLDGIIITHAHFDHMGSASYLQRKFGWDVFAHPRELPYLRGERKPEFSGVLGKIVSFGERFFRIEYPRNTRSIEEIFDVFSLDEIGKVGRFGIIHTPGHTPGSISIRVDEKLICGDLFRGGRGLLAPKAFCSDYSAYLKSVNFITNLEFSYALPGHGDAIPKGEITRRLEVTGV
jgi:glyoxylase-like metal-dependent hydrolase (beta-lactamase superfamily II)